MYHFQGPCVAFRDHVYLSETVGLYRACLVLLVLLDLLDLKETGTTLYPLVTLSNKICDQL